MIEACWKTCLLPTVSLVRPMVTLDHFIPTLFVVPQSCRTIWDLNPLKTASWRLAGRRHFEGRQTWSPPSSVTGKFPHTQGRGPSGKVASNAAKETGLALFIAP